MKTFVKNISQKLSSVNINVWFYLTPLVIVFLVESIVKLNPFAAIAWMFTSFIYFVISYLLVLSSIMLITSITNSYRAGIAATTITYLILAIINSIKYSFLGNPLLPGDISMLKNITSFFTFLDIRLVIILIPIVLALVAAISYGIIKLTKKLFKDKEITKRKRIVAFFSAVVFLYLICVNYWFMYQFIPSINANFIQYNQNDYNKHGFIFSFNVNARNAILGSPDGYDKENMNSVLANYPVEKKENIEPNIIAIMSETFWDPTKLEGVSYSQDPMPNIRKLNQSYTNGYMLSPSFGGFTCNVEFEFLTGLSNKYLPEYSIPYMHYIKQNTDSIADLLKEHDYKTIALHTYHKEFFNRNTVYPYFGFDQFIGLEDIDNPAMKGPYVSDDEFANQIIQQFESKGKQNLFLFGVSMQNHLPYTDEKYSNYDIDVTSDILSEDEIDIMRNYAQGIYDADASLAKLIDYFSKVEEPTVLVFFGDHLPSLGTNNSIYTKLGYSEDLVERYSTPYLIWSNYELSREDIEYTSANLLGNQLLNQIGITKNEFYSFQDKFIEKVQAIRNNLIMDQTNKIYSNEAVPEDIKELEKIYEQLQYYILFDKYKENNMLAQTLDFIKEAII